MTEAAYCLYFLIGAVIMAFLLFVRSLPPQAVVEHELARPPHAYMLPKRVSFKCADHFWNLGHDCPNIPKHIWYDHGFGSPITEMCFVLARRDISLFPELEGQYALFVSLHNGTPIGDAVQKAAYRHFHEAEFGY